MANTTLAGGASGPIGRPTVNVKTEIYLAVAFVVAFIVRCRTIM